VELALRWLGVATDPVSRFDHAHATSTNKKGGSCAAPFDEGLLY
jgi:hypothetical protein